MLAELIRWYWKTVPGRPTWTSDPKGLIAQSAHVSFGSWHEIRKLGRAYCVENVYPADPEILYLYEVIDDFMEQEAKTWPWVWGRTKNHMTSVSRNLSSQVSEWTFLDLNFYFPSQNSWWPFYSCHHCIVGTYFAWILEGRTDEIRPYVVCDWSKTHKQISRTLLKCRLSNKREGMKPALELYLRSRSQTETYIGYLIGRMNQVSACMAGLDAFRGRSPARAAVSNEDVVQNK